MNDAQRIPANVAAAILAAATFVSDPSAGPGNEIIAAGRTLRLS